jgi:hypothetical protein
MKLQRAPMGAKNDAATTRPTHIAASTVMRPRRAAGSMSGPRARAVCRLELVAQRQAHELERRRR